MNSTFSIPSFNSNLPATNYSITPSVDEYSRLIRKKTPVQLRGAKRPWFGVLFIVSPVVHPPSVLFNEHTQVIHTPTPIVINNDLSCIEFFLSRTKDQHNAKRMLVDSGTDSNTGITNYHRCIMT